MARLTQAKSQSSIPRPKAIKVSGRILSRESSLALPSGRAHAGADATQTRGLSQPPCHVTLRPPTSRTSRSSAKRGNPWRTVCKVAPWGPRSSSPLTDKEMQPWKGHMDGLHTRSSSVFLGPEPSCLSSNALKQQTNKQTNPTNQPNEKHKKP